VIRVNLNGTILVQVQRVHNRAFGSREWDMITEGKWRRKDGRKVVEERKMRRDIGYMRARLYKWPGVTQQSQISNSLEIILSPQHKLDN
jgi:hypothetical protein